MNIKQLKELLDTYGNDFSRWPPEQAKSAHQFIKSNPKARALLNESGAIDALFGAGKDKKAPKDLLDKIMKKIDSGED